MWGLSKIFRKKSKRPDLVSYIRKNFGFTPNNIDNYELSLRHSSASFVDEKGVKNSNERLEFLGDTILDVVVAEYLYDKYPKLQEGELTKMKSKVVSRVNLNQIAQALNIQDVLEVNIGKQDLHHSILGNALEAIVGAIYLDKGYKFTQKIVLKFLKREGLNERIQTDVDFKSKLHEWSQKHRKTLKFKVIYESQKGGTTEYVVELFINGKSKAEGKGKSKKLAEQEAAKKACEVIFNK